MDRIFGCSKFFFGNSFIPGSPGDAKWPATVRFRTHKKKQVGGNWMFIISLENWDNLCRCCKNDLGMIWNYLKIAFRSLRRNQLVSFINIFGLGLSMSVGMLVLVILQDQLGYDSFHPFPGRTFRIISA